MRTKKQLLALFIALIMAVGSITVFADGGGATTQPLPFTDVAATAWYYPHVRTVWENNLFIGTAPNTFNPQGTMTRAMFIQVFANIEGVDLSEYPNIFEPNRAITREEMAVMLHNYITIMDVDFPQTQDELPPFTDQESISEWAVYAVGVIQATGIIEGYPNGSFQPRNESTRAEVATIFARYLTVLAEMTDTADTEYFTLAIANITGQDNRHGTVTIVNRNAVTYDLPAGTNVTVRATAASGYEFDGWFSNVGGTGAAVSRNRNHTFTITADTNLFARFRIVPTDTSDGNETTPPPAFIAVTGITMTSANTVQEGTPLTLTATVAPNNATNRTIAWSVENAGATGATITSGNVLNTTAAGTVTVRATIANGATATTNFIQDFTVTVTAAPPATYTVTFNFNFSGAPANETRTVNSGQPVLSPPTYNCTGYTFIGWFDTSAATGGTEFETSASGTAVTANRTVYARWTPTTFNVTMTNDGNGTASTSHATTTAGTTVTITATPTNATTHQFYRWVVVSGGATLSSTTANPATFTMPTGNVEIRAEFELTPAGILANEMDRLINNGNPHNVPQPGSGVVQVVTGLQHRNGVLLEANVVAASSPSGIIAVLMDLLIGNLQMNIVTGGVGSPPVGDYVFNDVRLVHTASGEVSAPFTIIISITP